MYYLAVQNGCGVQYGAHRSLGRTNCMFIAGD